MIRVFLQILTGVLLTAYVAVAVAQTGSEVIANFPRYQTTLSAEQDAQLQRFSTAVAGALSSGYVVEVSIYGHADFDAQGRDFEIGVSQERARIARQSLEVKLQQQLQLGVFSSVQLNHLHIVDTVGLGTLRPRFAAPRNEVERRANRRVEFVWVVKDSPVMPTPNAFARCITVLQASVTTGPGRRMSCVCSKLAAGAADTHYEFSARRDIPGSAGMPHLTTEQWHAAMSQLIHHMRRDITSFSDGSSTDPEFARALITLDDRVGLNINNFASAAAPDLIPGLFDRVIIADIRARMADPNHIYSCYAGYSRRHHEQ